MVEVNKNPDKPKIAEEKKWSIELKAHSPVYGKLIPASSAKYASIRAKSLADNTESYTRS